MARKRKGNDYPDVKPWVRVAVAQEDNRPSHQLWKGAPSPEMTSKEHRKRLGFLRKHGRMNPKSTQIAVRLENCQPDQRCLSGACLQCAQLLQRWYVRAPRTVHCKSSGDTRKGANGNQHRATRVHGDAGPAELIFDGQFPAAAEIHPGKG